MVNKQEESARLPASPKTHGSTNSSDTQSMQEQLEALRRAVALNSMKLDDALNILDQLARDVDNLTYG